MHKSDKGAANMRGRTQRNKTGELRKIRKDTKATTLEKRYSVDFQVRGDKEWGSIKKEKNVSSVKKALKKAR